MKKFFLFFTLFIFTFSFTNAQVKAQSDKQKVEETLSELDLRAHIGFLASDALKGRDVRSDGIAAAAAYIASNFQMYGVNKLPGMDSYYQAVGLKSVTPPSAGFVRGKGVELKYGVDFIQLDGNDGKMMQKKFLFVNHGLEGDYKSKKAQGKILVALCGDGEDLNPQSWFSMAGEKRKRAKEAGALGLIEIYSNAQLPWKFLTSFAMRTSMNLDEGDEESSDFQHLWMNTSDEKVLEAIKKGKGKLDIAIEGSKVDRFTSNNVVGWIEGSDPKLKDEFVIYSAHYDHIGIGRANEEGDSIYNGTRDNAIGTSGVLAAVKQFSKYPTKRSALFILFTAEEKGLLGSSWFVDHSPIPLNKIAYCFNIDNAGYNNTELVTVFGLERTTVGKHMINACKEFGLRAIEDPAPEQNLFDRSDNVNFAKKGIPAPTFSMGFDAFDDRIYKYYHQANDNPDSVDYEYILKYVQSFLLSGRLIANDPAKPFWTEGDKYYDAGKELYGN